MGKLTAKGIESALKKPGEKIRKIADGQGLYLEVTPRGKGRWRFKYRFAGRENRLSLGLYPDVTLRQARDKHQDMRRLLAHGIDPSAERKAKVAVSENTFEVVAREWIAKEANHWEARYTKTVTSRLELKVLPYLGARPVDEISSRELLQVVQRIEAQKKYSTAHDVLSICARVFRYAIQTSRAKNYNAPSPLARRRP